MIRYKYTKLRNLGPVHGFLIHTPDGRKLKDTHPQTIVRELNRMADRIKRLEKAGDAMDDYILDQTNTRFIICAIQWREAKEANP